METKLGQAMWGFPPTWRRGPARLDGDWIVLDVARAEEYEPHETPDILLDFLRIEQPSDALDFVRGYGLLVHGPEDKEHREQFSEWLELREHIMAIMTMIKLLARALTGEQEAITALWSEWEPQFRATYDGRAVSDEDLLGRATVMIAANVSLGMGDATQRLAAAIDYKKEIDSDEPMGPPGVFAWITIPSTVRGYIYYRLGSLLVSKAPLAECLECGHDFVVEDKRQQYCTPTCAGRARYRRWAQKRKEREGRR